MTRYTDSDIEVHLGDITDGWASTDGVDVPATQQKIVELIEEGLLGAYPDYTVSIFSNQSVGHFITIVGYPDDVNPDDLLETTIGALDEDGTNFLVFEN